MKKGIFLLSLCFMIISCKKEVSTKEEIPISIKEVAIPKIDSTALLDSIARVDSISRIDSLAKIKALKKNTTPTKKKTKKPAPKLVDKSESSYKSLIFNVQLGINPSRKNWVLFKNGTYVIFPDGYTKEQMKNAAVKLVKSFNKNTLTIQKSNFAKGWIASTNVGIYNFIGEHQIKKGGNVNEKALIKGRNNILKDKSDALVVHINTN